MTAVLSSETIVCATDVTQIRSNVDEAVVLRSAAKARTFHRRMGLVGLVSVAVLTLCGCSVFSGVGAEGEEAAEAAVSYTGDVPEFSGPWAADFTSFYSKTTSDFERQVLSDEKITDQELAEMRSKFTSCLEGQGATEVSSFKPDGGFSLKDPPGVSEKRANEILSQCSSDSGEGSIASLYAWIRRNPQNLDENEIMAACLVRKGAVEPGYTAAQYAKDWEDDSYPYTSTGSYNDVIVCSNDPLGLFE